MTTNHHYSNCKCGKRTRQKIFIGLCLTFCILVYLLLSRAVITYKRSIQEKARISEEVNNVTNLYLSDLAVTFENLSTANPTTEKLTTERPITERPTTERPTTEKPTLEKPETIMTKSPITERPTMVPQPLPPLKNGFRLIFPHIEPKLSPQEKKVNVVAIVISAAKGEQHRRLRETIRNTWGKATKDIHQNQVLSWKMFFALALADSKYDQQANLKEADQYNDVIMGNFTDTYRKLVWKTFMSYYWVNFRIDSEYILKADDDVYVRVPELITWLQSIGNPKPFYGGFINSNSFIIRAPNSPWYVSVEQYNATHYPPWCHGPFYVFSSMNIPKYLKYIHTREPFMTEDTYIAVISKELGIDATHIPGFKMTYGRKQWTKEEFKSAVAVGHRLNSNDLVEIHRYYMNRSNSTL